MYPADLLGSTYGADDLPDAVTVNWTDRFTGSMSKSGSGYAGGGATLQVVNGIWRLSDSNGTRNVGRCLIQGDGNLTQGDDLVEDQFEDTYTVTINGEGNPVGPAAGEPFGYPVEDVIRGGLCRWYWEVPDEQTDIELFFLDGGQKWGIFARDGFFGGQFVKTENQDTPEGNYILAFPPQDFGFAEGATATVAAP
jgi:PAS domain-containing protein